MNIIQSNPYRVLGVYSNAPKKEIIGAENKIKAFVKIGRPISFKTDFIALLGDIERTEDSLAHAVSSLTLAKDKIRYALFWFLKENAFDEVALNHLASGNIDSAIEILHKKITTSSYINLAVCSLIKRQWANALYCYSRLIDTNRYEGFISAIAGEENVISKEEISNIIIDSLEQSYPEVNWLFFTRVKTINWGTESIGVGEVFSNSFLIRGLRDRYLDKICDKINEEILKADKADRKNPSECLSSAKVLSRLSTDFKSLQSIIGKSDIRYTSLSDKVAEMLNRLCIGYYNNTTDYRRARVIFPFVKDAFSFACSDSIKAECKKGLDFISERIEELPPAIIEKECQEINNRITNFDKQDDNSLLSDCLTSCQKILSAIKNKVGEKDKNYINLSSLVVHFALDRIVDEVNTKQKAYENAPDYSYTDELNEYKNSLLWAVPIMYMMASFAKDEQCRQRYQKNRETLSSLYSKYCLKIPAYRYPDSQTLSSLYPTSPSRGSSRPTTQHSSYSNYSDDSSNGCLIGALVVGILFIIVMMVIENASKSSSAPVEDDAVFITDTNAVDTTTAYIEESDTAAADTVAVYDYEYGDYESSSYDKSQDDYWLEIYKNNSLATGATPYRSVYGGNSKTGNAWLKIKAPTNCDVLVIIKRGGQVVKHAYIRSNQTYSFTLRAGTYQPFFIFGKSWCPEKEAPNGELGYFLENVSISKDYPQEVGEYEELEYTLQTVRNGNFHAASSNEYEAF